MVLCLLPSCCNNAASLALLPLHILLLTKFALCLPYRPLFPPCRSLLLTIHPLSACMAACSMLQNPQILLLNIELELKSEKENAEIRLDDPAQYQSIVDAGVLTVETVLTCC